MGYCAMEADPLSTCFPEQPGEIAVHQGPGVNTVLVLANTACALLMNPKEAGLAKIQAILQQAF